MVLVPWKTSITSNEEEWRAYVGTEFRDITGPAHLLSGGRPALHHVLKTMSFSSFAW